MSERMRECPRCERRTLHVDYRIAPDGDRASAGERVLFGMFTFGFSELVMERRRRCLVCGYTRQP